ncbi:hypothetical protein LWI29_034604 [Acer saccharum]|uniref:RNase H type-1 domain-containing protein n=1 Tax=Acer saccharum TaxID=4024 RepID=A0AA39VIW2_ACESA|nr:hypothetical protein LWI29_034604 [Acer saccharum]
MVRRAFRSTKSSVNGCRRKRVVQANCDIAIDKVNGKIGFGIIIRNCKRELMASCSQQVLANFSLKSAKFTAVCKSIIFSCDCGLILCSFEVDDANIVRWIANGDLRESDNGSVLEDIDSLVAKLGGVSFCHTNRVANRVAKGLANFALKCDDNTFWMEEVSSCVSDTVIG